MLPRHSRITLLARLCRDYGTSEQCGRLAWYEGDPTDNPQWEFGLYREDQTQDALEWADGYDAEAMRARREQTQRKAA